MQAQYFKPLTRCRPISSVGKRIAIGAEGLGFDSRAGQTGHSSPTARHRCDDFLELCCTGAKPLRRAPPLNTCFDIIPRI